ncbi:MAG: 4-hydroxythreonine-4-phosphate dehydrogenase PdxA [Burkholderiaceae bacterium]|jgi:4-hydroxythreonine-4-phosphate dehydrogenase|nr:4-hydroxythreonine-4-phosphate dehydrogenase PdxA [Burkholderiaceae bacterium]
MNLPLVITMGDPAGIGPEIIAKAFRDAPEPTRGCFVAGDVAALRRAAQVVQGDTGVPLPVAEIEQPQDALHTPPRCVPVLQAVEPAAALPPFGQISQAAGRMAGQAVFWAARAALRGEVGAIVTAPLNKAALAAAGAPYDRFPGHTELLQAEAAAHRGVPPDQAPVRMMLANDELRTVLVSIHVSLREAIERVTAANVLQTLRIAHAALARALPSAPRLAVAGLNPHAGEGGLFGREEIEQIAPAIEHARREGINAHGPLPPDTVFMRARQGQFDAVIAMYHDQGLIPVKYLGVEQGVNVTLGLPFVRTSPDHGTAFDIAGTGRAAPARRLAALRMAQRLIDAC